MAIIICISFFKTQYSLVSFVCDTHDFCTGNLMRATVMDCNDYIVIITSVYCLTAL